MLFRKKKKQEQKEEQIATNQSSTATENNQEQKLDLNDMIKACDHYAGTENEVFLVGLLADSLLDGTNGITKDLDMAYSYYQRLSKLDEAAGICGMGKTDIAIGLERDDRFRFSLGVNTVYEAYKLGSEEALRVLRITAESGMFEKVTNLEEMLKLCEECNDIKT